MSLQKRGGTTDQSEITMSLPLMTNEDSDDEISMNTIPSRPRSTTNLTDTILMEEQTGGENTRKINNQTTSDNTRINIYPDSGFLEDST